MKKLIEILETKQYIQKVLYIAGILLVLFLISSFGCLH